MILCIYLALHFMPGILILEVVGDIMCIYIYIYIALHFMPRILILEVVGDCRFNFVEP